MRPPMPPPKAYEEELEDIDDEASNVTLSRDPYPRLARQRHQRPVCQEGEAVDRNTRFNKAYHSTLSR